VNPPPNPLLIEKAINLEIRGSREKAAELKDLAQASYSSHKPTRTSATTAMGVLSRLSGE
jgi:hypothetical protein